MNKQIVLIYFDKDGKKREETHGIEAQAIAYALAYEAEGFRIESLVDRFTGKNVHYTSVAQQIDFGQINITGGNVTPA